MANTTRQIDEYIRSLERSAQRDQRASQAAMPGAIASAVNGLTFGFGDELVAGARSLFGSTSYEDALGQERASREQYAEQHPALAAGAELAGSAPSMLLPMGWAARGLQGVNRIRAAATTGARAGAATGALQGAGEGEGVGGRVAGAATGAGVGGALGAAGGAALEGLAPVARTVRDGIGDVLNPQRGAERTAAGMAAADIPNPSVLERTVGDAAAAEAVRTGAGLPGTGRTLAEVVGPNTRGTLEGLAHTPGQAMTRITGEMEQRGAGRMDRVLEGLRATFGDAEDAYVRAQQLYAQRSASAGPLYDAAFQASRPLDAIDMQLLRQVPRSAVQEAQQVAGLQGRRLSFTPEYDDNGFLVIRAGRTPTAEDMHRIKVGLDRMVENNTDALTGRANSLANAARGVRDTIRSRLDALTTQPDGTSLYRQARQTWAGPSANVDAMNLGRQVFDLEPARLRAAIADMSEPERQHFVEGAMNSLRQRLGDVRVTGSANPVNAIAGSRNQQEALRVITDALGLPPQEAAQRFQRLSSFLSTENAGQQAENQIMRNSATARRQAFQQALAPAGLGGVVGAGGAMATEQDPLTGALLGAGAGAAGRNLIMNRRNDALATLLSVRDPVQMRDAASRLAAMQRLQQQQAQGLNPNLAARAGIVAGSGPAADPLRRGLLGY